MKLLALILLAASVATCQRQAPAPAPAPSASSPMLSTAKPDAGPACVSVVAADAPDCERACARGCLLGCGWALPSPGGVTCTARCGFAVDAGIDLHPQCVALATHCDVGACGWGAVR